MRVLLIAQYFSPETVGAAIWLHQLAVDLTVRGHQVTFVTGFPNQPDGVVFPSYRGKMLHREQIDGVNVIRTYLYTSPRRAFWHKLLNFATFSMSAGIGGLLACQPDVIYAVLPPLPLGVTANWLGMLRHVPTVVNIQDVWPDAAVSAGLVRNRHVIRFLEQIERLVYSQAQQVVVISETFRHRLHEKGVNDDKIVVIPNWADPDQIHPSARDNSFRHELNVEPGEFVVVYSGGISHNSCLETLIDAAHLLKQEPFFFVIVGDGVKKTAIEERAAKLGLERILFLPFQPLHRYPDVLAAADINVVALHKLFTSVSVPSKTLKIMASGRPMLALASEQSEVYRIVQDAACGVCSPPDDAESVALALRYASDHRAEIDQMGANGRLYLQQHFSRGVVVKQIESLLVKVASDCRDKPSSAGSPRERDTNTENTAGSRSQ